MLRTAPELAAERRHLDGWLAAQPDRVLAIVAEMDMSGMGDMDMGDMDMGHEDMGDEMPAMHGSTPATASSGKTTWST